MNAENIHLNRREFVKGIAGLSAAALIHQASPESSASANQIETDTSKELSPAVVNSAIKFTAEWIDGAGSMGRVIDGGESSYGTSWQNSSTEMQAMIMFPPAEARILNLGEVSQNEDGTIGVTAEYTGFFGQPNEASRARFSALRTDEGYQMVGFSPLESESELVELAQENNESIDARTINSAIKFTTNWIDAAGSSARVIEGAESTFGESWKSSSEQMQAMIMYYPTEARILNIGDVSQNEDGTIDVAAELTGLFGRSDEVSQARFSAIPTDDGSFQMVNYIPFESSETL